MEILKVFRDIWDGIDYPFLIYKEKELRFSQVINQKINSLSEIENGDVVAIIGDFDPKTILTFLKLINKKVIIVPLTIDTKSQHDYFLKAASVNVVIHGSAIKRLTKKKHELVIELNKKKHAGLILFSTGTTGRPKAILHDFDVFLQRIKTPRPTLKTINFLLFDHIGGLNTLFHTLFNRGTVITANKRTVSSILEICDKHLVEVLPATPTFLRMMLISGLIKRKFPKSLKIITYGTERMDQPTLNSLCKILPNIDFRQTYGMSELGILRIKSYARDSLYMKIGGEGIETRVVNNTLEIRSKTQMVGYLNAKNPFDKEGWYNTGDLVEEWKGYYKIVGRKSEVINVGGLKFMASEVERVALDYKGILLAKAVGRANPITGNHLELIIQISGNDKINQSDFKLYLIKNLPRHMVPARIKFSPVTFNHRFKKN